MRIIGKRDIERYMTRRANAATPLRCWVQKAERSEWKTPTAIRADFASVRFLSGGRNLSIDMIRRLREMLGISADFLIGTALLKAIPA